MISASSEELVFPEKMPRRLLAPTTMLLPLGFFLIPLVSGLPLWEGAWAVKWLCIYVIAMGLSVHLVVSKQPLRFPRSPPLKAILSLLVGSFFLAVVLNPEGAYETQLLDWISFGVIALASSQYFSNRHLNHFLLANQIATVLILSMSVVESFFLPKGVAPAATFDHQNMLAEYLALSSIFQVYGLSRPMPRQILKKIILFLTLVLLVWTGCRAAMLGLLMAALLVFISSKPERSKQNEMILGLLIFTALAAVVIFIALPSQEKQKNNDTRLARWANTLVMIRQNPWGLGPGRFEFGYLPYRNAVKLDWEVNDRTVMKSPHNGYLEAAAEGGVLFFIALCVAVVWVFVQCWRQNNQLVLGLFSFVLVDALFAFPMENPFPLYVMAIATGMLLNDLNSRRESENLHKWRWAWAIPAAIFVLVYGSLSIASRVYDVLPAYHAGPVRFLCKALPSYWPLCLKQANHALHEGDSHGATILVSHMLDSNPWNYLAYGIGSEAAFAQGDRATYCAFMERYEELVRLPLDYILLHRLRCASDNVGTER